MTCFFKPIRDHAVEKKRKTEYLNVTNEKATITVILFIKHACIRFRNDDFYERPRITLVSSRIGSRCSDWKRSIEEKDEIKYLTISHRIRRILRL